MRALETHWNSVRWISRKLPGGRKRSASRAGPYLIPNPTSASVADGKGDRKEERLTGITERPAHKLLQHEGRADNLGFVRLARGLGHQEHIREQEQVHIQLRACKERDKGQLEQGWSDRGQAWVCGQHRAAGLRAGSPSVWARLFTGKKVADLSHSNQQSKARTISSSQHTQTHTERHMDTDIDTDTHRETYGHTHKDTHTHIEYRHRHRDTERHMDTHRHRHRHTQRYTQRDTRTHTQTHTHRIKT